jgi:hypothetical protein
MVVVSRLKRRVWVVDGRLGAHIVGRSDGDDVEIKDAMAVADGGAPVAGTVERRRNFERKKEICKP